MAFKLPELDYAYNALEPYIDEDTMKIHHTKHHQAYLNNLNKIIERTEWEPALYLLGVGGIVLADAHHLGARDDR